MRNRNGSNNGHSNGTGNGLVHINGNGNGHKPDAAIVSERELLWDGMSPAVANALAQPLDPALVSQRKGRAVRAYDYLEGHVVIDQANRIFGFGGWGFELAGDVTLRQIETVDAKTGEVKRTRVYSAPVRVSVPGAPPRTDVGFHLVAEETAEGHETACKGAVTDGMKRTIRSFGDRFGNGFYGDRPTASIPPKPERRTAPANERSRGGAARRAGETQVRYLRKRLVELGLAQGFDEEQVRAAVKKQTNRDLDDLPAPELMLLVESAIEKLHQMQQAKAD